MDVLLFVSIVHDPKLFSFPDLNRQVGFCWGYGVSEALAISVSYCLLIVDRFGGGFHFMSDGDSGGLIHGLESALA